MTEYSDSTLDGDMDEEDGFFSSEDDLDELEHEEVDDHRVRTFDPENDWDSEYMNSKYYE